MKTFPKTIFLLFIVIIIGFISCKKEKEVVIECGCESEVIGYADRIHVGIHNENVVSIIAPNDRILFELCEPLPDSIVNFEADKDNRNEYFFWGSKKHHCLKDSTNFYLDLDSAERIVRGCEGTRISYIPKMDGFLDKYYDLQTDSVLVHICKPIPVEFEFAESEVTVSGFKKWRLLSPFPGEKFYLEVDSIWFKDPPE